MSSVGGGWGRGQGICLCGWGGGGGQRMGFEVCVYGGGVRVGRAEQEAAIRQMEKDGRFGGKVGEGGGGGEREWERQGR